MVPLTQENLEVAKKLSNYMEIRKIYSAYMRMYIIDNTQLFQFKTPLENKDSADPLESLDHMLYTNDKVYISGMRNLLDFFWEKASSSIKIELNSLSRYHN